MVLTLKDDVSGHPVASRLTPAVMRAFQRRPWLSNLIGPLRPVEIRSPAGLIIGNRHAFEVDWRRLRRTVGKITRGLFYLELKRALPPGAGLTVWNVEEIARIEESAQQRLIDALKPSVPQVLKGDVLAYFWRVTGDQADASVWFLRFYGAVPFMVFTWPVGMEPRRPH